MRSRLWLLSTLVLAACSGSSSGGSTGGSTSATTGTGATSGSGATSGASSGSTSGSTSGSGSSSGTSGDAEPADMAGMTAAHNAARASVSPPASPAIPPLQWSSTVAATAQAWANGCVFQHSGGQYGENLYATSGTATPQDVVNSWVSESANYDYANNTCSGVCGHYTQVVWRDSLRLGCAKADCSQNSPFGGGSWQLWVCNYDPPGNFNGQQPY